MKKNDYSKEYSAYDSTRMFLYVLLIPYLAMFLLYGVYMIIGTSLEMQIEEFYNLLPVIMVNTIFVQVCFVVIFFVFNHKRKINFVSANKLNTKFNPWMFAVALCMGFALMFFSNPMMGLFERGLNEIGFNIRTDLGFPLTNAGNIIFAIIALALLPAFLEELIFRGAILQGLKKYGEWFAIIVSAFLFMLIHSNIQQTIYQFAFGVLAGWAVIKTGSLWTSIAMHGLNNLFIIVVQAINECNGTISELAINTIFIIKSVAFLIILGLLMWLGVWLMQKLNKKQIENVQEKSIDEISSSISFKDGCKQFFMDKTLKKETIIGIVVAIIFFIINTVSMLQ